MNTTTHRLPVIAPAMNSTGLGLITVLSQVSLSRLGITNGLKLWRKQFRLHLTHVKTFNFPDASARLFRYQFFTKTINQLGPSERGVVFDQTKQHRSSKRQILLKPPLRAFNTLSFDLQSKQCHGNLL